MCYKCGVCGAVVGRGVPRRVHTDYRVKPVQKTREVVSIDSYFGKMHYYMESRTALRREIAKETPICESCERLLLLGNTVQEVKDHLDRERKKRQRQERRLAFSHSRRLAPALPCGDDAA